MFNSNEESDERFQDVNKNAIKHNKATRRYSIMTMMV